MNRHPSNEAILNSIESEAPGGAVGAHLAECARCRARAEAYIQVLSFLQAPGLVEPPARWVRNALARLKAEEAPRPAASRARRAGQIVREALETVRAAILLDSGSGPALAGIRGTSNLQPRQILYGSRLGEVHLRIEPEPRQKLAIQGQLVPAGGALEPGGQAILEREGIETKRRLSESGEFRFPAVAPGRVRLRVEWGSYRLALDPIDLAAEGRDA